MKDIIDMMKRVKSLNEVARRPIIKEFEDEGEISELDHFIDSLVDEFGKEFYSPKLDEDEKVGRPKYNGTNVTWYGKSGASIVIPLDAVYTLEGNIFNDVKLEYLTRMISDSPERVELTPGYVSPHISDVDYVKEYQINKEYDEVSIDTTGSEELDAYCGLYEPYEFMERFDVDSDLEFLGELMSNAHLEIAKGNINPEDFIKQAKRLMKENGVDFEYVSGELEEFLAHEDALSEAIEQNEGTLGQMLFQMRDGNHRYLAAKAAGETHMLVIVETNTLQVKGESFLKKYGYDVK